MPKWIGNRFGNNVPADADSYTAAPAVYNMNDQYFLEKAKTAWYPSVQLLQYLIYWSEVEDLVE